MPGADYLELMIHLKKQENDEKLFFRWVVGYQYEMSFDEFKQKITPMRTRPDEEIMNEVYKAFEKVGTK